MNDETKNYRMERIERLLNELRYEITRGMMEGEIDETLGFTFIVPRSKQLPNGVVWCEFRTRPTPSLHVPPDMVRDGPKLRVVK